VAVDVEVVAAAFAGVVSAGLEEAALLVYIDVFGTVVLVAVVVLGAVAAAIADTLGEEVNPRWCDIRYAAGAPRDVEDETMRDRVRRAGFPAIAMFQCWLIEEQHKIANAKSRPSLARIYRIHKSGNRLALFALFALPLFCACKFLTF